MRRLLAICLAIAAAAAIAVSSAGAGDGSGNQFTVELDNAFGIVKGADLKVAGVRAGKISDMRVDRRTRRALIDFEITKDGFGSLRKDVFCESRPQSLIGEYFIDCQPGTDPAKLPAGATIPVEQTASTIPVDLINNVLREPYRERLGIILDELGAGVAGRADDLNEAIRRASPALRETDRVLAKLADQNQVLKNLVTNADTVIGDLAGNRRDVGRWVSETRDVASASAERRADIRGSLQRLPTFLRELRPTMAALGAASDAQNPSLRNLNASAGQLTSFLENLEPFAEASQVNLRSLAKTSRRGRPAVKAAQPTVAELSRATAQAPELTNNLAIVLEHLDDRKFAVEKDSRSPGGQGYTGMEALLQYPFDQALSINTFDRNGYILKINLFVSKCSEYQNRQTLEEHEAKDPGFFEDCGAQLGPNLPGITQPDPTATGRQFAKASASKDSKKTRKPSGKNDGRREARSGDAAGGGLSAAPAIPLPRIPSGATRPSQPNTAVGSQGDQLLDFLFAP